MAASYVADAPKALGSWRALSRAVGGSSLMPVDGSWFGPLGSGSKGSPFRGALGSTADAARDPLTPCRPAPTMAGPAIHSTSSGLPKSLPDDLTTAPPPPCQAVKTSRAGHLAPAAHAPATPPARRRPASPSPSACPDPDAALSPATA